eukprot:8991497-Pyramimonas_sp.AAC.1
MDNPQLWHSFGARKYLGGDVKILQWWSGLTRAQCPCRALPGSDGYQIFWGRIEFSSVGVA